jgi:hypothetical protein
MAKVNGQSTYIDKNGNNRIFRKVLKRNVLDMLEGNEKYGELDFCDAEIVTDMATEYELFMIYTEQLDPEKIEEILAR